MPGHKPAGHYENVTMISAIRQSQIVSSMVFKGACDTIAFCVYLDKFLLPKLAPNDVLVMDNLQVHKTAQVRDRLQAHRIEPLYLPPYSPDLNPIERMFSKVKNEMRSIAARTIETVFDAFGDALRTVTSSDLNNWIRSATCTKKINALL